VNLRVLRASVVNRGWIHVNLTILEMHLRGVRFFPEVSAMKRLAIAGLCLMALSGYAPAVEAHGFSFEFSYGYGRPHGFYRSYGYYPGYVVPYGYYPPAYVGGIYFPGSALGLRYYAPYYNYGMYRGYRPSYRHYYRGHRYDHRRYIPRRYYRRTYFRD
jgi:hypothetical protein